MHNYFYLKVDSDYRFKVKVTFDEFQSAKESAKKVHQPLDTMEIRAYEKRLREIKSQTGPNSPVTL